MYMFINIFINLLFILIFSFGFINHDAADVFDFYTSLSLKFKFRY